jgi:hypothetical protein
MKKLEKWKAKLLPIVESAPFDLNSQARLLKKLGFKRLHNRATRVSQYGLVFINKKDRVVVKESYFKDYTVPKKAIPTVFISDKNKAIVIQPLARTLNEKEESEFWEPEGNEWGCDAHSKNVAFYRNRLVLIDW